MGNFMGAAMHGPIKPFLRYLAAAFLIGLFAVWGSENLFWSAPNADLTAISLLLTWIAYSICAAAALSASMAAGLTGWRGAFLGGALLGWTVEGVVVTTMYDAFPAQLVWTPLAWHALVTGLAVFALSRAAVHWSAARRLAAWAGLGLFGALFAQYWPIERGAMPSLSQTAAYLAGLGLAVPAANILLDRLGPLDVPPRRWLTAAPALLLAGWLARLALGFNLAMFALPALAALTIWIMFRLGRRGAVFSLGAPSRKPWRHLTFMAAPLITACGAAAGWRVFPQGLETNIPVALSTGVAGLALFGFLAFGAARTKA